MPHKYTTEEVIKRLENEMVSCETSIKRTNSIARGDKDGFQALKDQIKDFRDTAKEKKDDSLDMNATDSQGHPIQSEIQERVAYLCRGQEKAFQIVLDMLEDSNSPVAYYENQIKRIKEELQNIKKYEVRKEI